MASILYYRLFDECPCCPGRRISTIDYQNDTYTCEYPGTLTKTHDLVKLTKPAPIVVPRKGYERVYVGCFEVATPTLDLSRFPHKCPRCGMSCYIGVSTEHAIGTLDKTCR